MSTAVLSASFAPARIASPLASHLRLTRRGRAVVTALIAVPFTVGAALLGLNGGMAEATVENSSASFEYVSVESGQSLWQLAESLAPGADPREVISDIAHLNQLESVEVQPGQRLAIPQAYSD